MQVFVIHLAIWEEVYTLKEKAVMEWEDQIMITVLEHIIHSEEVKPVANQDTALIDDCIREIAELKGVKSDFSYEEITEIITKLIDTVNGTASEER